MIRNGTSRRATRTAVAAALGIVLAAVPACGRADPLRDSLRGEIEHWSAYVRAHPDSGGDWKEIRDTAAPILGRAETALRDGRSLLALQRLSAARAYLAAEAWVERVAATDSGGFEAEWSRARTRLARDLAPPRPAVLASVRPAALAAFAEAALPQIRVFHEASLEYGRNTQPGYGLFYIGQAEAQHEFVAWSLEHSERGGPAPPPLRSIAPELDSLESEILAAYRPPASIERHPEFIGVSAALKEARELDAAGLRRGALQRYLVAAQRFAALGPAPPRLEAATVRARLGVLARRLDDGRVDHSIGRLFLELAESEAAAAGADSVSPVAAAIASDVLPRYFAALGPAPPAHARPAPEATVTLVRWPYT